MLNLLPDGGALVFIELEMGMADLFASVSDDAVNRIIDFAHVHAPYLFNYVAPSITFVTDKDGQVTRIDDLWLVCSPVPDPPEKVPKYKRMPPFALPGIPIDLPYSIQIIDLALDFHPSDAVALPPELLPPLAPQHFALKAMLQFGLACVPPDAVALGKWNSGFPSGERPLKVLPVTDLICFVISIAATGHLIVTSTQPPGAPVPLDEIHLEMDGVEIVDIEPKGLENAAECYLVAVLRGFVLPQLVLQFQQLAVNAIGLTTVTPSLTPKLPNNPAIEQNELRIWLDVKL